MTKSIVFIDSRVANYQSLIDSLTEPAQVFILDGASDGLAQMATDLQGQTGIDAIHVISHGSQGALYLGSTVLDSGNLSSYGSQLASIGSSLTPTGDILMYGCNVAQGDMGLQFINSLAQYTGADVAASSDATGAAALGGDWVLEQATGGIEALALRGDGITGILASNTAPTFTVSTGKVTTDFGSSSRAWGYSVTVQADGKILFGGTRDNADAYDFALARYNTNGSLDTSFDGDGKLTTDFDAVEYGRSLAVQADGKILLGGYSAGYGFALARYNTDGSLDTSFDGDGKVITDFGSRNGSGQSVTVQPDGKILLGGYTSGGGFALARYNTNGSLDTSFDGDGKLTTDFGSEGASVALQTNGKILVGGFQGIDFALTRYNTDGSLDTSFDGDGKVITDFGADDRASSVTVQADGKILLAGYTNSTFYLNFALARYNTDGSLDTSFSGDGKVTTGFGQGNSSSSSVTIQADGKILLGGQTDRDFALARYNSDGSLDTSFSEDGKVTTNFGTAYSYGRCVTVQANGKILLGGTSGSDFALVRYNTDGSLDNTFSPPANTLTAIPFYTENYSATVLDANVQIVDAELVAANNYNGATLTLYRHGGASIQDVFSEASGGTLTTLTPSSYFAVDSVTIGRVTTNSAGTLTLTFNTNATQSLVNSAMQQIAYANTSDAPPASVQIDWTFNDGNTGAQGTGGALSVTGSTTVQITATNDAPVLSVPLVDQNLSANSPFSYTVPAGSFTDPDLESLSYSVIMADGTGVPPWLSFNAATHTFSGTPGTIDAGTFDIRVTAKDSANASVSDIFRLTVAATANQTFTGTSANESFTSGPGNDTIDGGGGTDTAIFSGVISDYFIRYNRAQGTATITDHRAGGDGTDSLTSVEKLQFSDHAFDLINLPRTHAPVFNTSPSFLFDAAYYLLSNPSLAPSVTLSTAYNNYVSSGAAQGAAPNSWFDPVYYANRWPDLTPLNLDAATLFMHYNLYGVWEGRSAGPAFDHYDGTRYLADNPDVAAYVDAYVADFLGSRSNGAIAHYVIYGANEGRVAYDTSGNPIEQAIVIGTPG